MRLSRFARVRLLRHPLPISLLILRKKPTVLQSNSNEAVNETKHYGLLGVLFFFFTFFFCCCFFSHSFDQAFVAVNAIKS